MFLDNLTGYPGTSDSGFLVKKISIFSDYHSDNPKQHLLTKESESDVPR